MIPCIDFPSATHLPCFVLHTSSHCPCCTWPHFIAIMRSDLMIPNPIFCYILPNGEKVFVDVHFFSEFHSPHRFFFFASIFLFPTIGLSVFLLRCSLEEGKLEYSSFLYQTDFSLFVLFLMSANRVGSLFLLVFFYTFPPRRQEAVAKLSCCLFFLFVSHAQYCTLPSLKPYLRASAVI